MQKLHVYGLPDLLDPRSIQGETAVVIDVLRATTTTVYALHSGAARFVPLLEVEDALALKDKLLQGEDPRFPKKVQDSDILLGGERKGVRIEGFDLGNSPKDYSPGKVSGKIVLFSTTNGTRAMYRAEFAESIYPACFLNAKRLVEHLLHHVEGNIHILCAGTDGKFTEEDMFLAGLLVQRLQFYSENRFQLNTAAVSMLDMWNRFYPLQKLQKKTPLFPNALAQELQKSRGGTNLLQIGLGSDIHDAAQLDSLDFLARIDPKKMIAESFVP